MPRRTMTVTELWAHPRGKRDQRINLSELPDGDLLHLFHTFAGAVTPEELLNTTNESYAAVQDLEPVGRSLTLAVEVGRYGEKGRFTDTRTMTPKGEFTEDDAILVVTHGVLTLPKDSTSALLFLERSNNQCGVLRILDLFKARFNLAYPDMLLETDPVVESEAWLENASLVRVSAFRHSPQHDRAENIAVARQPAFAGELAHTLLPPTGAKTLPRWIYDRLSNGTIRAGELLGFSDPENSSAEEIDAEVTLEYRNRRKTFVIGRERRPSISYSITGHSEDALTSQQVRNLVFRPEYAPDLYDRIGIDWVAGNTFGAWTPEQLEAKMVIRGGEQS